MTHEQHKKVLSLLERNEFGVVATNSDDGAPESAVVAFSEIPELCVIFGSFKDTRKNKNITRNQYVSIVVGWEHSTTVQMEGRAELVSGEEREKLEQAHCNKNEGSQKYRNDPRQEYFKITPTWIRYSDFSVNPQEVWEVHLK